MVAVQNMSEVDLKRFKGWFQEFLDTRNTDHVVGDTEIPAQAEAAS